MPAPRAPAQAAADAEAGHRIPDRSLRRPRWFTR